MTDSRIALAEELAEWFFREDFNAATRALIKRTVDTLRTPPPNETAGQAVAVLTEMLKAYDSAALQMSSPEIGEPENDIPYHPWHEELLYNARQVVATAPQCDCDATCQDNN